MEFNHNREKRDTRNSPNTRFSGLCMSSTLPCGSRRLLRNSAILQRPAKDLSHSHASHESNRVANRDTLLHMDRLDRAEYGQRAAKRHPMQHIGGVLGVE